MPGEVRGDEENGKVKAGLGGVPGGVSVRKVEQRVEVEGEMWERV